MPQSWDLAWSYDCSSFGTQGNFQVFYDYYSSGGQLDLENSPVNQLGASGSSVEHYHSGGNTKYLVTNSECN